MKSNSRLLDDDVRLYSNQERRRRIEQVYASANGETTQDVSQSEVKDDKSKGKDKKILGLSKTNAIIIGGVVLLAAYFTWRYFKNKKAMIAAGTLPTQ